MMAFPSTTSTDSSSQTSQSKSVNPNSLSLLANISSLGSVKLDQTYFILWKYQITSVLRAYDLFGFIDGSNQCSANFVVDENGKFTNKEKSRVSSMESHKSRVAYID